jgi:hypothetical protein
MIVFPNLNENPDPDLPVLSYKELGVLTYTLMTLNGRSSGIVTYQLGRGNDIERTLKVLGSYIETTKKRHGSYMVRISKSLINRFASENPPLPLLSSLVSPEKPPTSDTLVREQERQSQSSHSLRSGVISPDKNQEKAPSQDASVDQPYHAPVWLEEFIQGWSDNTCTLNDAAKNSVRKYVREAIMAGKDENALEDELYTLSAFLEQNRWIRKRDLGYLFKDGIVGMTESQLMERFKVKVDKGPGGIGRYEKQGHPPVVRKIPTMNMNTGEITYPEGYEGPR